MRGTKKKLAPGIPNDAFSVLFMHSRKSWRTALFLIHRDSAPEREKQNERLRLALMVENLFVSLL